MNNGKIAIFGCNTLGLQAAQNLRSKDYDFVVVDDDEKRLALAREKAYPVAAIDYRSDEDLLSIGIGGDIGMIFCFFSEDSENVFLVISARSLDVNLKIVSIVDEPESADKLLAAGADKIIDPYEISGRKIYELIKRPVISDIMDKTVFGEEDLNLAEIEIPRDSWLEHKTLKDLDLSRRHNLILIGIVDKELSSELCFATSGANHKLDAGDILVVMGPSREILAFKDSIEPRTP